MNMALALVNAQRRPAEEARRITEAVGAALVSSEVPGGPAAAVQSAISGVNQQIADEKSPRLTQPPPEGHLAEFADTIAPDFTGEDAEPSPMPTLRSDSRFLIGGEPPAREAEPVSDAPPWETTPEDATEAGDWLPADAGDHDQSSYTEVPPESEYADTPPVVVVSGDEDEDVQPDPSALDPRSAPADSDGERSVPREPWAPAQPPSPTDSYAELGSPWGDDEEILAAPATTTAANHGAPTPDSDDEVPFPDAGPVPSMRATDPPEDFEMPEPSQGESLPRRVRELIERTLRNRSKAIRIGVLSLAAIMVIALVAVFSLSGGRGEPPTPAEALPPPPAQTDNPEPTPAGGVLLPATVSASCGNDSDPVAPFAGEKSRAWVCTRIDGLDLNVLNITFDKPVCITTITVVPGFNYVAPDGRDEWSRHRLVTAVSWRMGGAVYPQVINPTRTGVTKQFDAVCTQEMSMTVTASTRPPLGKDQTGGIAGGGNVDDPSAVDETTAVSEITINGYPVDPGS